MNIKDLISLGELFWLDDSFIPDKQIAYKLRLAWIGDGKFHRIAMVDVLPLTKEKLETFLEFIQTEEPALKSEMLIYAESFNGKMPLGKHVCLNMGKREEYNPQEIVKQLIDCMLE